MLIEPDFFSVDVGDLLRVQWVEYDTYSGGCVYLAVRELLHPTL